MGAVGSELGRRIVALRLARGMSQEQLAEKTGLALRTIGDIERGITRRPHRETLRVLFDGLGPEASERAELYGLARKSAPPSTRRAPSKRPDLAAAATPLVGRDDELAQLADLVLDAGVRLVSVVGAGGVGKSRLALEAGWRLAGRFDRVVGADLSVLDDPADVPQAVADAVRCRVAGREPLDALAQLVGDGRWLLVLDSFEHVGGAARWVADLLGRCHRLTVLATSRSPLRLRGEHVQRLLPLAGPQAVELLVQRVSAVRLGFRLTDSNTTAVRELCRRLDGLPLAIELAAAQLAVQEPADLLAEISAKLPELVGAADMPDRHQTLRLTVEWSTGRLDQRERLVLGALAVFVGGASPADLEAVLKTVSHVRGSVAQLAADSLVSLVDRDGTARITMLDTVREVAASQAPAVRESHALHFLDLLRSGSERVDAERDNVRAAVWWAVAHRADAIDVALVKALTAFHVARAQFSDAHRVLLKIAEATSGSLVRAWAVYGAAVAANESGRAEEGLRLAGRCAELFTEPADVSAALTVAGNAQKFLGRYPEAQASHRDSLDLARAAGDRRRVTISLNNLGTLAHDRGAYDTARAHYRDSLAIKDELGDRRGAAVTRMNLAGVENDLGAYESARAHLVTAVAAFRELSDTSPTAYALGMLAESLLGLGREEAEAIAGEALAMAREAEYRPGIGLALARLGDIALARSEWDTAAKLLAEAFEHANGRPEQARTLDRLAAARASAAPDEARDLRRRAAELRATHDVPVPPVDHDLHAFLTGKLGPAEKVADSRG
ncbi:tetratricopeptide repeat protein [Actinoplanes sp. LDG1-06]|uniref:Tetratricopeptide repeat protein n=1 Tax=Paractinoplanes ovalisporus TaxID=2810368 RepID=A0ABS2AA47_9ACTN|nr:tetratricopeptide repeat protein [Actinoplanes ovalisporus]MBM2616708.1 tetratricopeptide repeat protein [Actinoplanes ovalisporus]